MSVAFFGVLLLRINKIKSTDSVQNFSTKYGKIIDTCKWFLLEGYLKFPSSGYKSNFLRINSKIQGLVFIFQSLNFIFQALVFIFQALVYTFPLGVENFSSGGR